MQRTPQGRGIDANSGVPPILHQTLPHKEKTQRNTTAKHLQIPPRDEQNGRITSPKEPKLRNKSQAEVKIGIMASRRRSHVQMWPSHGPIWGPCFLLHAHLQNHHEQRNQRRHHPPLQIHPSHSTNDLHNNRGREGTVATSTPRPNHQTV